MSTFSYSKILTDSVTSKKTLGGEYYNNVNKKICIPLNIANAVYYDVKNRMYIHPELIAHINEKRRGISPITTPISPNKPKSNGGSKFVIQDITAKKKLMIVGEISKINDVKMKYSGSSAIKVIFKETNFSKNDIIIFSECIINGIYQLLFDYHNAKLAYHLCHTYVGNLPTEFKNGVEITQKISFKEVFIDMCNDYFYFNILKNEPSQEHPDTYNSIDAFKHKVDNEEVTFISFLGQLYLKKVLSSYIIESCVLLLIDKIEEMHKNKNSDNSDNNEKNKEKYYDCLIKLGEIVNKIKPPPLSDNDLDIYYEPNTIIPVCCTLFHDSTINKLKEISSDESTIFKYTRSKIFLKKNFRLD